MTREARSGDGTENSGLQLELSCAGSEAELLLTFFPSVLVYVRGGCDRETFSRGLWKVFFYTCSQHTIIKGKQRRGKF